MAEKIEKGVDLEKALDESLAELAKAAHGDEKKEDEYAKGEEKKDDEDAKGDEKKEDEDAKGDKPAFLKKKGDKDDEDEDDEKKKKDSEDSKGEEKKDDEDAKGEDEDAKGKKEDDEDEKSMRDGHKSAAKDTLTKSETVSNAIEVSKFLREIVKAQSDMIGEMSYRLRRLEKSQASFHAALAKSQAAQNDIIKSFGTDVEKIGRAPLPRKGVTASIEKSFRGDDKGETVTLSKSQIAEKLCALEIEGKVPFNTTTKFEATGELNKSFEKLVHESK